MKRITRKVLGILLSAVLIANTVMPNVKAEELINNSVAEETVSGGDLTEEVQETVSTGNEAETGNVYVSEDFQVTYLVTSEWEGAHNATLQIQNTSEEKAENWYIRFPFSEELTNIWNAQIHESTDGYYVIKNDEWNQDILAGGQVEFGFTVNGNFSEYPDWYELLGQKEETIAENYSIEYRVDSDWGNGFTGNIQITNNTETALEDWVLEFDFARTIDNIWNGIIESCENNHYTIRNAEYNSNIAAGESISFGFSGQSGTVEDEPQNYKLYVYEPETVEYVQLEDGKIEKNYLYRAIYSKLLKEGVSIENVKLADDYDGDGITLGKEYEYDTDPFSADTDEDGLSDYEEIYIYGTKPGDWDTDNDLMSDGTEIACNLNPLSRDTDEDGINDDKEIVQQKVRLNEIEKSINSVIPSITITGAGDYSRQIYVEQLEDNQTINSLNFVIGNGYDFIHEEDLSFEQSTLTFSVSQDVINEYDLEDLVIAYYDEKGNILQPLETDYDFSTNSISAQVEHYSIYMVISISEYLKSLQQKMQESVLEGGRADIVFVIDTTGSMQSFIDNVKNNISTFTDEIENNNIDVRLGLVTFKDIFLDGYSSKVNYGWYNDVDSFKSRLDKIRTSGGGGDGPETSIDALYTSVSELEYRSNTNKYIILITDDKYKNGTTEDSSYGMEDVKKILVDNEISVSVMTYPSCYTYYNDLVTSTKGVEGNIANNFVTEMSTLIMKVSEESSGHYIRLSNGTVVQLDGDPNEWNCEIDTDEDGLPDIDELSETYTVNLYNPYTKQYMAVETWSFYSNPAKADTDGDGLDDLIDVEPTNYTAVPISVSDESITFNSGRTWYNIGCSAYDYLDNILVIVDWKVDNPIPMDVLEQYCNNYHANKRQEFSEEELAYIGVINNEGAKLYLDDKSAQVRERIIESILGRDMKYYRHSGILGWSTWTECNSYEEGGFFKGAVLSEADINLSTKLFYTTDVYEALDALIQAGVVIVATVVTLKYVVPAVMLHVDAFIYYCQTYGIKQGVNLYKYCGTGPYVNGLMSWMQQDLADGDSSIDDVLAIKYKQSDLNNLKNTSNFTDSAVKHIFEGEVKSGTKATGYHYEQIEGVAGKVVPGTKTAVNQYGVYKAQVEVNGILKEAYSGYSTFFPKRFSPQEVINAINEAYNNKIFVRGNTYLGMSESGIEIKMHLDNAGKIISAYPLWE